MTMPQPQPSSPPDSPPPIRAVVTSENGEITCSVEETNRIRAALGLKPLRTSKQPSNEVHAPANKSDKLNSEALGNRLEAARRARHARARVVATRSIAEEALLDDADDEEDANEQRSREAELEAWVKRSRMKESERNAVNRSVALRGSRTQVSSTNERGPSVLVSAVDTDAVAETPSVFVLADTPVLEKEDDAEDKEGDELENVNRGTKKRPRSPEIDGFAYDGTDNAEFASDRMRAPGAVSVALDKPRVVGRDEADDVNVEKAFKRRSKREKGKRSKRKRRRAKDSDDSGDEPTIDLSKMVVVKGRMQELRRAADAAQRKEDAADDSDDDPLYRSLAMARKKAADREVASSVDVILNAINRANEVEEDSAQRDEVLRNAEQVVYDEMEQFLQKIPTGADESSSEESDIADQMVEENRIPQSKNVKRVRFAADEEEKHDDRKLHGGVKGVGEDSHASDNSVLKQDAEDTRGSSGEGSDENSQPGANSRAASDDSNSSLGVASVLNRLRARGELKHKAEQIGRARDKRFDEDEPGMIDTRSGRREVKLEYMDEFGNKLTPKEAFRVLCHKFHGKGPGQNKREKRLRHMLESMRTRNMQSGDTPLASAAALKEETRKLGNAFVVLSGSEALLQEKNETATVTVVNDKESRSQENEGRSNAASKTNDRIVEEKVTFTLGAAGSTLSKRRRR